MTQSPDSASNVGFVLRIVMTSTGDKEDRTWPVGLRVPVRGDWMRVQGQYVEVQTVIWETPGGTAAPSAPSACRTPSVPSRLGSVLLRVRRHTPAVAAVGFWLAGAEIPATAQIGDRVKLNHLRQGLVVHPSAIIGNDVTLMHRVTIGAAHAGMRDTELNWPPVIVEDGCVIGCGAVILGDPDRPTVLGKGTVVGANAVVTHSTDPGSTIRP